MRKAELFDNVPDLTAQVEIGSGKNPKLLTLDEAAGNPNMPQSSVPPGEPHEFDAQLRLSRNGEQLVVLFAMSGPKGD